MKKDIISDICDIECDFSKIENLIKILKDAVENNDDAYYLLAFVEILEEKVTNFADFLENFNQDVSKIINIPKTSICHSELDSESLMDTAE